MMNAQPTLLYIYIYTPTDRTGVNLSGVNVAQDYSIYPRVNIALKTGEAYLSRAQSISKL